MNYIRYLFVLFIMIFLYYQLNHLLILFYLLIIIILYQIRTRNQFREYDDPIKSSKIPKHIYTYWNDENIPPLIKKCIDTWKKYNPTYQIHVIHKNNLSQYINPSTIPSRYTHQQQSDLIRLSVLETYGGIWMDASIYLNQSLDWIHTYQYKDQSEYIGFRILYYQTINIPVVESWFMASIKGSRFIKDWKNSFFKLKEYPSEKEYVDQLKKTTDIQGIDIPYYLAIHVSCQSILQQPNRYKLSLLDAEGGPLLFRIHPYYHLFMPGILYFTDRTTPLVKLRFGERKIMELLGLLI